MSRATRLVQISTSIAYSLKMEDEIMSTGYKFIGQHSTQDENVDGRVGGLDAVRRERKIFFLFIQCRHPQGRTY